MSELSTIGKITKVLEIAKRANVGAEFTHLEAIELLGHIKNLEEAYGLAESELAALREQTRWIPVEERLPDSGVDVLTCSIGYQYVSEYSLSQDKKSWRNAVGWPYALESVTHWMPLPPPPEVK